VKECYTECPIRVENRENKKRMLFAECVRSLRQ